MIWVLLAVAIAEALIALALAMQATDLAADRRAGAEWQRLAILRAYQARAALRDRYRTLRMIHGVCGGSTEADAHNLERALVKLERAVEEALAAVTAAPPVTDKSQVVAGHRNRTLHVPQR